MGLKVAVKIVQFGCHVTVVILKFDTLQNYLSDPIVFGLIHVDPGKQCLPRSVCFYNPQSLK